jgi:starch-binding outer membrane protein SusE/F
MNMIINRIIVLFLVSLAMFACEKDEERIVVKPGTAPVLTASSPAVVLSKEAADQEAVAFSWTPSDYGYSAAVKYTLQLATKGSNFAEPKNLDLTNNLEKKYTNSELNAILGQLDMAAGTAGEVEARVKSEIAPSITPVYSNVLTLTATPYLDIIEYPSLYVPGNYQGWAPDKAPKVSSVKDDKIYEGYVNFTEATNKFKFTSAPDWSNTNYGDGGTGKLSDTGGDLTLEGAGYYLVKVNLNDNTWSATRTAWGVIGNATETGWDADTDLMYDPAAKVWKATLALKEGELKFRANDGWDINLGDNKPANSLLTNGGENILIKEAGTYEVTLNISIPGNYTYTLRKI